jgi:tetratricopeptide (TPR) repeat protein
MEEAPLSERFSDNSLSLPAAVVRLVAPEGSGGGARGLRDLMGPVAGVRWLRDDLFVVLPVAGDPAIHDLGARLAARLLAAAAREGDGDNNGYLEGGAVPGALVIAGWLTAAGALAPRSLQDELDRDPPSLAPGEVVLSSRVADRLEVARRLGERRTYYGPSGSRIPLIAAGLEDPLAVPWRNPTLFRHPVTRVRRSDVEGLLRGLEGVEVLSVFGPAGSGKTRSVAEALRERDHPAVWVSARPERHGGPGLAVQIVHRLVARRCPGLLDSLVAWGVEDVRRLCEPGGAPAAVEDTEAMARAIPRWIASLGAGGSRGAPALVLDDLHVLAPSDRTLVERLIGAFLAPDGVIGESGESGGGAPARLILMARPPVPWRREGAFRELPEVRVSPMGPEEMARFSEAACRGLPLPAETVARFSDEVAGLPFAFEEGLAGLAERDMVHDVHGSLLFRGGRDTAYGASARLVAHTEAELGRCGDPTALRVLALTGEPTPERALLAAARRLAAKGAETDPAWLVPFLESGLVREAEGPWGGGIDFACPAHGVALAETVPEAAGREMRRLLGEALAEESRAGSWRTYRLLEGTEAALDPLLAAARDRLAPKAELARAVDAELARRRVTGIGKETELDLLWSLLPLLRRQGRLAGRRNDLARALELAGEVDPGRVPALAGLQAELAEDEGRLSEAETLLRHALAESRGRSGDGARALLLLRLGRVLVRRERYAEARSLLEGVIPVLDGSDAGGMAAGARFLLANVALHENRLEEALGLHHKALEARRRLDRPKQIGVSLSALGTVTLELGRYTESLAFYREAEERFRAADDPEETSFAQLGIGRALGRIGDFLAASRPLRSALELRKTRGDKVGEAIARLAVAENHLQLGQPDRAFELARRAHFDLSFHSASAPLADAEQLLGRIHLVRRELEPAARHLTMALDSHRRMGRGEAAAFDLSWLLQVALQARDRRELARLVTELEGALAACPRTERREILETRLFLGLERLDRDDEGRVHLERAYKALLEKTGHLPAALRHRFLHDIPEHRILAQAAARAGIR